MVLNSWSGWIWRLVYGRGHFVQWLRRVRLLVSLCLHRHVHSKKQSMLHASKRWNRFVLHLQLQDMAIEVKADPHVQAASVAAMVAECDRLQCALNGRGSQLSLARFTLAHQPAMPITFGHCCARGYSACILVNTNAAKALSGFC
jgi:hypothetical protein